MRSNLSPLTVARSSAFGFLFLFYRFIRARPLPDSRSLAPGRPEAASRPEGLSFLEVSPFPVI